MDALSDVLRVTRLKGGVFLHAEFSAPWCMAGKLSPEMCEPFLGPVAHLISYHYVIDGEMIVKIEGEEAAEVRIGAGGVILLPHNHGHMLGSEITKTPAMARDIICPPANGGLFTISHGGGGESTKIVCGFLGCDAGEANPVLASLPPLLTLDVATAGGAEWIRSTFKFAADEVASGRPGSDAVLAKLSELLFVEAIRRYLEDLPEGQTGWLAGLQDPYVSRALALLHATVDHPWTIDELASRVGLSRSALADRFVRRLGMAPIQYLAYWRMQVAAQELRNSSATLGQIATMVGYDSEAAFSRAFKKAHGVAPAGWRRYDVGVSAAAE